MLCGGCPSHNAPLDGDRRSIEGRRFEAPRISPRSLPRLSPLFSSKKPRPPKNNPPFLLNAFLSPSPLRLTTPQHRFMLGHSSACTKTPTQRLFRTQPEVLFCHPHRQSTFVWPSLSWPAPALRILETGAPILSMESWRPMTYATMTDLELVEAARQNQDKRAFAILLQRYQRPLYNYILRMIGQAAEAEELFQETFLRIYQNLEHFRGGASFSPWAYRIAHNICIDALRSPRKRLFTSLDAEYGESNQSLEDVLEGRSPNPEDELYRQQLAFHIQEAVEKLPVAIRSVFVLYQYQHLPYEQIAETLSIPLGTVKSRMHTALRKLSHSLRQFSDSGIDPRELYEQQKAQEKNQSSD